MGQKAQTPAREGVTITVEDEAAGIAARVRRSQGGERLYNVSVLQSELDTLRRNQANGYGGWEFRISVLARALALIERGF